MDYEAMPEDVLVRNTCGWQGRLALRVPPIRLAVPLITMAHARDSIAHDTRAIVSETTMRDGDVALVLHFGV